MAHGQHWLTLQVHLMLPTQTPSPASCEPPTRRKLSSPILGTLDIQEDQHKRYSRPQVANTRPMGRMRPSALFYPAPCFYLEVAPSSLPLVKEQLHVYSPKIAFGPLKATTRLMWPLVKMSLTPLFQGAVESSKKDQNRRYPQTKPSRGIHATPRYVLIISPCSSDILNQNTAQVLWDPVMEALITVILKTLKPSKLKINSILNWQIDFSFIKILLFYKKRARTQVLLLRESSFLNFQSIVNNF